MADDSAAGATVLFGAFDRHNFGDLLFPHIAAALLPGRRLLYAGLAARDLRGCGGHDVTALADLAHLAGLAGDGPLDFLHAGGELLTCSAWEAAVMLLPPERAQDVIGRFGDDARTAARWARRRLRLPALAPYLLQRSMFARAASVRYCAVGGVDLDRRDSALRAEVLRKLRDADGVTVRDARTQALLEAAGIAAGLLPDPAAMTAELFGARIRERVAAGEVARTMAAMPQGYIALQFAAEFGDDATLDAIALQLRHVHADTDLGFALFCAGVAPWHDDPACYRRMMARMQAHDAMPPVRLFESPDLWDICALIAGSRGYAGSSLHGRIVAMAFGLPRINLRHRSQGGQISKQEAYAATWEEPGLPGAAPVEGLAEAMRAALAADRARLAAKGKELAARYRAGFAALCGAAP